MVKRLITLLFVTVITGLLTSCSSVDKTFVNEYIAETDFPYLFHSESSGARVTASNQGYYFLNGSYVFYMDKQGEKPVLLDNRPDHECLKSEETSNCNAYVSLLNQSSLLFQYYEKKLYTIEFVHSFDFDPSNKNFTLGHYELIRRDEDGSNRKVMKRFPNATVLEAGIHRGALYYAAADYDKDGNYEYQILRLSLNKKNKEPEVLYKGQHKNGSISRLIPYGAQLYFLELPEKGMFRVMRLDLNDLSATSLWESEDGSYPNMESIYDQNLYFWYYYPATSNESTAHLYDERSLKFYSSALDGSHIELTDIPTSSIISKVYMDDAYTYVRPVWFQLTRAKDIPDEMKIYKEGKLVHTVDMSNFPLAQGLFIGDDRYMFIQATNGDMSEIHVLKKDEIESGTATFKTLIENSIENLGQS